MSESTDPYDQIPYPSLPSRRTHTSHLAAVGRLLKLDSPSPRTARVLELGCAAGGNLMPMAGDYPEAKFLGFDLSSRQIEAGRQAVAELGFKNLELRQADLLALDIDEIGEFDYIICHGVYSWVPRAVQDRILAIGKACLAPQGIFFVSFNAYPGWHLRGMVREMLIYHVAALDKAADKIQQARALLEFLIESSSPRTQVYRQVLREEAEILKEMGDAYLFHEHLESVNEPLYFHQFAERIGQAGLQYLGDTDFGSMLASNLGESVNELLKDAPALRAEQYLDFLQCRTFRGALLCQPEANLDRQVSPERLVDCSVSLEERLEFSPAPDGSSLIAQSRDQTLTIRHPALSAALLILQERFPAWISFEELRREVRGRVGAAVGAIGDDPRERLASDLLTLYVKRLVRLWIDPPPSTPSVAQRPKATSLAIWQANQRMTITNLRHERIRLSPAELLILASLDGSREIDDLQGLLGEAIARGDFEVRDGDRVVPAPEPRQVSELLQLILSSLARHGLLAE